MRRARLLLATALAGSLVPNAASAQVSHGGLDPTRAFRLDGDVPVHEAPPVDVEGLLLEDELAGKGRPFRFGAVLPADLGPENAGAWEDVPGGRVWRLAIHSPGAEALAVTFDRWLLPVGAELYAHDPAHRMSLGAFTAANNRPEAVFAIQPVLGDVLVLEYFEPDGVGGELQLHVDSITHAYRDIYGAKAGDGDGSGGCNVNVACPLGDGWEDQSRSVAKLVLGGFLCSGALVNNTAEDGRQFLLTANHCQAGNPATWTFVFNNEAATCSGTSGPSTDSVVGCQVRASSAGSDFALVEITPDIPPTYEVYFAGWDRSGANPTQGTGIHHPSGDIKKICRDDDVITEDSGGTWLWHVSDWEQGVTEGGSSGSPLFDQNRRIVGQLCCGTAFCGFVFDDFYGQFDRSWDFGASTWLDPLGTGQTTLDGLGDDPPAPPAIASFSPPAAPTVFAFEDDVVAVNGTGFGQVTDVLVDGASLGGAPPLWTQVSAERIDLQLPLQDDLDPVTVELVSPLGNASALLPVEPPSPPALRLNLGKTPEILLSVLPADFTVGGEPGDVAFLYGALSDTPSVVPGVLSLDIGAGFTGLYFVEAFFVGDAGWGQITELFPATVAGPPLYFQAFTYDPVGGALPVESTNVSEAVLLF